MQFLVQIIFASILVCYIEFIILHQSDRISISWWSCIAVKIPVYVYIITQTTVSLFLCWLNPTVTVGKITKMMRNGCTERQN